MTIINILSMYFSSGPYLSSHQQQAEKAWHTYRQLEDSFISEVFMGQLKSTLQCSVCKGSSVTFDPFWDICLPIPSLKLLRKLHVHNLSLPPLSLSSSHSNLCMFDDLYLPYSGKGRQSTKLLLLVYACILHHHLFQDISLTDCIREFTREEVLDGDEKPVSTSVFDDPYLISANKISFMCTSCRYVPVVVKLSAPLSG